MEDFLESYCRYDLWNSFQTDQNNPSSPLRSLFISILRVWKWEFIFLLSSAKHKKTRRQCKKSFFFWIDFNFIYLLVHFIGRTLNSLTIQAHTTWCAPSSSRDFNHLPPLVAMELVIHQLVPCWNSPVVTFNIASIGERWFNFTLYFEPTFDTSF